MTRLPFSKNCWYCCDGNRNGMAGEGWCGVRGRFREGVWASKYVPFLRKLKLSSITKGEFCGYLYVPEPLLKSSFMSGFLNDLCSSCSLWGRSGTTGDEKQGYGSMKASGFPSLHSLLCQNIPREVSDTTQCAFCWPSNCPCSQMCGACNVVI